MWRSQYKKQQTRGVSAVEMLVGISIVALILVFSTHALMRFVDSGRDISERTQALYLAEGGIELVRHMRDKTWSNINSLSDGVAYYLDVSSTTVSFTGTPEVIDGHYTRSFSVEPVERNSSDDIVSSGSNDPDSKYLTVTVSWGAPTSTVELVTMIADISNP